MSFCSATFISSTSKSFGPQVLGARNQAKKSFYFVQRILYLPWRKIKTFLDVGMRCGPKWDRITLKRLLLRTSQKIRTESNVFSFQEYSYLFFTNMSKQVLLLAIIYFIECGKSCSRRWNGLKNACRTSFVVLNDFQRLFPQESQSLLGSWFWKIIWYSIDQGKAYWR